MASADESSVPEGLPELLTYLAETECTVPDELTRHLLRTVGVDMQDERALRMISLAAHNFIASVLSDAYLLRKQKRNKEQVGPKYLKQMGMSADEPTVLTTEDVSAVLEDAGVHVHQQMYYNDAKEPAAEAA
jgi:Transcription initiation factor TFIID 23-30kDa subunit